MTEPRDARWTLSDDLKEVLRKDVAAVHRFFHPDIEYVVNGVPEAELDSWIPPISRDCLAALPWLGLHRGRERVKAFLDHKHERLEVTGFGPREVIAEGDHAAAFGWFRLHARPSGRSIEIAYAIR